MLGAAFCADVVFVEFKRILAKVPVLALTRGRPFGWTCFMPEQNPCFGSYEREIILGQMRVIRNPRELPSFKAQLPGSSTIEPGLVRL